MGRGRTTPYGQNALVRQALDAAIDRAALVNVVFNGMYVPTVQAVPPSSPFFDEALKAPATRCGEGEGAAAAGRCRRCR